MLAYIASTALVCAVNDNSRSFSSSVQRTGMVSAAGRIYSYTRIGPGHYRLARTIATGTREVYARGSSDASMRCPDDGLIRLEFKVSNGRLVVINV